MDCWYLGVNFGANTNVYFSCFLKGHCVLCRSLHCIMFDYHPPHHLQSKLPLCATQNLQTLQVKSLRRVKFHTWPGFMAAVDK